MKPITPLLVIATLTASVVAVSAIARDALPLATQQTLSLKDGATLYVFKDGKMAKEDRFGRAVLQTQCLLGCQRESVASNRGYRNDAGGECGNHE